MMHAGRGTRVDSVQEECSNANLDFRNAVYIFI